jgi:hypothetical protein
MPPLPNPPPGEPPKLGAPLVPPVTLEPAKPPAVIPKGWPPVAFIDAAPLAPPDGKPLPSCIDGGWLGVGELHAATTAAPAKVLQACEAKRVEALIRDTIPRSTLRS